ncbi:MAG: shikimate kinase [Acidobacteria bacterium]|nr:shikimate kinase [Acidobacteriota bacterium]
MSARHIFLVGFMGSGKSTAGPLLAKLLDRDFHDLDEIIEKEEHMSISEIFESKGEDHFRDLESHCLFRTRELPPAVIALGGGTFVRAANRDFIAGHGVTVWLKIPLRLAQARCEGMTNRPLARNPVQFERLFYFREGYYRLTDVHIDVEGKSPEQICTEAQEKLRTLLIP